MPKASPPFWTFVDRNGEPPSHAPNLGPCWVWRGTIDAWGYGRYGAATRAHRRAYEEVRGPIPAGLVLDHLCRIRHCVNPDHLQAVTDRTNILRGTAPAARHAGATHCKHGHPFDETNTYVYVTKAGKRKRMCRECGRRINRAKYHKQPQVYLARQRAARERKRGA